MSNKINWNDFLAFRQMLTPMLIKIIFWLGSVISVILGIVMIVSASGARYGYGHDSQAQVGQVLLGLYLVLFGPIIIRIGCEMMILFFQMNETLTDIRNNSKPK